MLDLIMKVLGVGSGASVANSIGGVVNYATMAALGTWAWTHRSEVVTFNASVGFICLIVGAAVLVMEIMRRSVPSQPNKEQ